MKKLTKIFLSIFILNLIMGASFFGWMAQSMVMPVLKESDISIGDLFKKKLEPEKYKILEANINKSSSELGKKSARKVQKILDILLPIKEVDYSNMPDVPYPYPSINEVMEMNNQKAQEGFKQGLEALEQMN